MRRKPLLFLCLLMLLMFILCGCAALDNWTVTVSRVGLEKMIEHIKADAEKMCKNSI